MFNNNYYNVYFVRVCLIDIENVTSNMWFDANVNRFNDERSELGLGAE